nr:hypothetical protein HAGR004_00740 [Bdellovibrio sp. HAGR004]
MKILITLLYLIPNLWAQAPQRTLLDPHKIIYNPENDKIGRFVISYKEYEDIRIDSDWDGQIDYWYLRKGPLQVTVQFNAGQPSKLEIKNVGDSIVSLASYRWKNSKFIIEKLSQRTPMLMNLSATDAKCQIDEIKGKLASFSRKIELASLRQMIAEKLVAKDCSSALNPRELARLQNSLNAALASSINSETNIKTKTIAGCLHKPKFKEAYDKKFKSGIPADLIAARFQLQAMQLAHQADDHAPLITCEPAEGQKGPLATSEKRKIHLNAQIYKEKNSVPSTEDLEHELLHRSGLESEEQVEAVVSVCKQISENKFDMGLKSVRGNTDDAASQATKDQSGKASADTKAALETRAPASDSGGKSGVEVAKPSSPPAANSPSSSSTPAANGNQIAASQASANIPKEMTLAQSGIPDSPTLSKSITSPPPATEAGSQQALVQSASESSGVLRMANNLVGAMNTRAGATDKMASAESNITNSEVSSKSSATAKSSDSNKAKSNPFAALSRDKVSSNERIVEQITLDGNQAPSSSPAPSSSRAVSANRSSQAAAGQSNTPFEQSEVARGASASAARSSGDTGASFNATAPAMGGGSGGSPSRSPAAVKPSIAAKTRSANRNPNGLAPSQQASSTVTREEVVTYISNSSYQATKEKLQKPDFRKQLETQKITVLDLYGNTVGAPKGEVIFLDQGDKFVRQK